MSVATLLSAFLPFYDTLKPTLSAYRSAPEASENKPKLRSRKPQVDDIRRYTSAVVEEIQHVRGQFAFDGAMTEIQGIVSESTAPYLCAA
ncbi:hypothetical protein U1872_10115 [Sphingomonas sp. RB3P16]|uniref:hypothetical protein n=1 Tax=Parasphingomonas frigoris TaxID=3096163 RepID=UPI002FC94F16